MEHYKSTLTTAAVAAFGLLAAAHLLHPGNYEDQPTRVRALGVGTPGASGVVAWVDPPARQSVSTALSGALIATAQAAEAAPAQTLSPVAKPVAEAAPSPVDRQPVHASAEPVRKPDASRRRKVAQRRIRTHQAALTRSAQSEPALDRPVSAVEPARTAATRFDPIRALIHGLGLDS